MKALELNKMEQIQGGRELTPEECATIAAIGVIAAESVIGGLFFVGAAYVGGCF